MRFLRSLEAVRKLKKRQSDKAYVKALNSKSDSKVTVEFENQRKSEAIQILKGGNGILGKGKSIRENYHPITGRGLNAQNFSWSAAHIIMLLIEE